MSNTNKENQFNIDYSKYVDVQIYAVWTDSVKVKYGKKMYYVSKNHILYTILGIGEMIRADKNFLQPLEENK